MKKYLFTSITMAAAALLVTSCNDGLDNGLKTGEEGTVTFTAQLPSEIGTRAFADGKTAKHLQYAVYESGKTTPLHVFANNGIVGEAQMVDLKQQVSLKLTTGKTYDVIFWADATTDSPYAFNAETQSVTVDYDKVNNNSDNCDAFFKKETITVTGNQAVDVNLYRPFAQVNIGTDDYDAAAAAGLTVTETEVKAKAFGTLNLGTGAVTDEAERTFKVKAIPTAADGAFPVDGYKYLSMDYLLVGADKSTVDLTFNYTGANSRTFTNVPVQRNYRTNIYGSLLTSTTDFNVVIEPAFDGEYGFVVTPVSTQSQLLAVAAQGGSAKLEAAMDLTQGVDVKGNKDLTVDLNGNNVVNSTDLWDAQPNQWSLFSAKGGATLTLKGDGNVVAKANDCYAVDVQDGSHLVIEGGHYNGNIHAVYVHQGTAEIKGGTFEVQQTYPQAGKEYEFVLNCLDSNRANGTAKIIVTGGTFIGFNPADNYAEGAHTNFLADGYMSICEGKNAAGLDIWTVKPATRANVIAALEKDGAKVTIANDYQGGAYLSQDNVSSTLTINNAAITPNAGRANTLNLEGTNLTLNGTGTIQGPSNYSDTSAAVWVQHGNTLNIDGDVAFDSGSGSGYNSCVIIYKGTVNISGGHFRSHASKDGSSSPCVYLYANVGNAYLNITGGVFEADGDAKFVINCDDANKAKCTVKIMGGTFVGFNPADNSADGAGTNYVAAGYKSVKTTYNGKEAWKVVAE